MKGKQKMFHSLKLNQNLTGTNAVVCKCRLFVLQLYIIHSPKNAQMCF